MVAASGAGGRATEAASVTRALIADAARTAIATTAAHESTDAAAAPLAAVA